MGRIGGFGTVSADRGSHRTAVSLRNLSPPAQNIAVAGRRGKHFRIIAIYAVLAVAWFHSIWFGHPSTAMQLGQDQFDFVWELEWVPWAIIHGHNPFYSTLLNYPYGVNLVADTGVLLLGVVLSPVTLLFGPIAGFNVAQTLAILLSATSGYIFAYRFLRTRTAAFVAGLLYGFSPYTLAQSLGHLHLSFVAFPPLILLALYDAVTNQTRAPWKSGALLALLVILQFFVSTEILFDTVLIGAIALVIGFGFRYRDVRERIRHFLASVGWAAAIAAVVLAYPVWFAFRGPAHIAGKIQLVPQGYRADLLGSIIPDSRQLITTPSLSHAANMFSANVSENGSYLGVPLLIVVIVATVILWRSTIVKVASLTAASAFILSLGSGLVIAHAPSGSTDSGLPLPGRILAVIPVLDNAIPSRFALFVALFVALLFALLLEFVFFRTSSTGMAPWKRVLLPTCLVVLCGVPLLPKPLTGIGETGVPLFFTSPAIRQIPDQSTAVIYPFPSSAVPNAVLWQAVSHLHFRQPGSTLLVPGPDGHIAYSQTTGYGRRTLTAQTLIEMDAGRIPEESAALHTALRSQLRGWNVRSFVAFPLGSPHPYQAVAFFTWLFDREPKVSPSSGAYEWFNLAL